MEPKFGRRFKGANCSSPPPNPTLPAPPRKSLEEEGRPTEEGMEDWDGVWEGWSLQGEGRSSDGERRCSFLQQTWHDCSLCNWLLTLLLQPDSADAPNRRTQVAGLLYSCLQPVSTSFSSPGRHITQARCNRRGVPFACCLKNLQSFLGFR